MAMGPTCRALSLLSLSLSLSLPSLLPMPRPRVMHCRRRWPRARALAEELHHRRAKDASVNQRESVRHLHVAGAVKVRRAQGPAPTGARRRRRCTHATMREEEAADTFHLHRDGSTASMRLVIIL